MLELARAGEWAEFHRLSLQIHEMHVAWRPDIYRHAEAPVPQDIFLQLIQDKQIFVAKIQENVVGYVLFSILQTQGSGIVPRKVLRLDSIVVDEPLRHQGIGRQMMLELQVIAKAFGCSHIQLSVQPENDAAVHLYSKLGYGIRNINMIKNI